MNRTIRTLALPAVAAIMLAGCSLPFKIVPNEEEPPPTAQEDAPTEETPTEEVVTEEAETPVEVEETTSDDPGEESESEADGPNYNVGPTEALPQVVEICGLPDDILLDDGMTLVLDNPGEDPDSGDLSPEDAGCVIGALQMPDWVQEEIRSTTALDGRQKAVDGHITWSWTYSTGEGLDFLITVSEDEG